jgi:hypothetical protein
MAATYTPIASTTLGTAVSSVTFSSIPQTYTDLVLIISTKNTSTGNYILTRYNSDSGTNYSQTRLVGTGSTVGSNRDANDNSFAVMYQTNTTDPGICVMNIFNYSNTTTNKTAISRDSFAADTTFLRCGLWRNTSAITSISLTINGGNFNTGSTFNLYGILGANA